VESVREALVDYGYPLVEDRTSSGRIRWTGSDQRASPFEVLGADDEPAEVAIKIPRRGSITSDEIEAVMVFFASEDVIIVYDVVASARDAADRAGVGGSVDTSALISRGVVRATWTPPGPGGDDIITISLIRDAQVPYAVSSAV
jgi:hypothetical protein